MILGAYAAAAMRPSGPRLWTPAYLPAQPSIWADWDSSVVDVAGTASDWGSKGTFGGTFSASSGSARPQILTDELSGKRALRFDGVNDMLYMLNFNARDLFRNTGAGWVMQVLRKRGTDASGVNRVAFYAPNDSAATRLQIAVGLSSGANQNSMSAKRLDADPTAVLSAGSTAGAWTIVVALMDWASGAGHLYVNGGLAASNPALTSSGLTSNTPGYNSSVSIASTVGGTSFADIDVACVLAGSGVLPAGADRERLEGWSAWELGLQGILPPAHPYKSAAPVLP